MLDDAVATAIAAVAAVTAVATIAAAVAAAAPPPPEASGGDELTEVDVLAAIAVAAALLRLRRWCAPKAKPDADEAAAELLSDSS